MKKGKKLLPKKHIASVGDVVRFKFAGMNKTGEIIELTTQDNDHATYTVKSKGIIYPRLGLNGSEQTGYIIKE